MQWTTTTIKKNELKLCTVTDVQQTFYSFPVQKCYETNQMEMIPN